MGRDMSERLETSEDLEVFLTFDDMGLSEPLLRGINSCGFQRPSAIQQRMISAIMKGCDVIVLGQSDSGKTTAASISVLQSIDPELTECQALILSPTRELAVLVHKVISTLGNYMNVRSYMCIGGTNIREDIQQLNYGQHVVSGTPGRVCDMIRRGKLRTQSIKLLVLNKGDEMLNVGFKKQLDNVRENLSSSVQVVLISVTLPYESQDLMMDIVTNPIKIFAKKRDMVTLRYIRNCTSESTAGVHVKDLSKPEFDSSEEVEVVTTFDAMGLREPLLRGIYFYGFEKPSAIQQRAIKVIMKGHDVIVLAQFGSGKTTAFAISVLQLVDTDLKECQALILSPTRELALQIQEVVSALGECMNACCHACIGGTDIREDFRKLDYGQHVISGTPGRVFDLIKRGRLRTNSIRLVVLAEANRLLKDIFRDLFHDIHSCLPPDTQVVLPSVRLSREVLETASEFMSDPIKVLIGCDQTARENIRQIFVGFDGEKSKFATLMELYAALPNIQTAIFRSSLKKVTQLTDKMKNANVMVSSSHIRMTQEERQDYLEEFRAGSDRVLILTDAWAHGLEAWQFPLVINYDLVNNVGMYIHRIRWSKGVVINFVKRRDMRSVHNIAQYYSMQVDDMATDIASVIPCIASLIVSKGKVEMSQ